MKKSVVIIIIVMAVLLVGGGFALFHNSSSNDNTSSSTGPSSKSSPPAEVPPVNNAIIATKTDSTLGQYLTNPSGKPLYTFASDTATTSNCTGQCLAEWPAYVDSGDTTSLPAGISTIKRTDNGQMQFTYNGKPLYFFDQDTSGKPTGDGKDKFSIARPVASPSESSSSSSNSGSSGSSSSNSGY